LKNENNLAFDFIKKSVTLTSMDVFLVTNSFIIWMTTETSVFGLFLIIG